MMANDNNNTVDLSQFREKVQQTMVNAEIVLHGSMRLCPEIANLKESLHEIPHSEARLLLCYINVYERNFQKEITRLERALLNFCNHISAACPLESYMVEWCSETKE